MSVQFWLSFHILTISKEEEEERKTIEMTKIVCVCDACRAFTLEPQMCAKDYFFISVFTNRRAPYILEGQIKAPICIYIKMLVMC